MAAPAAGTADEAVKKRFATVDDEAFAKILYEKDAKNTRRATESAVRTFRSYLREKNLPETFESIPNNELDKILSKFYTEVRNENGELYKKATLISLRHGINRHLGNSSDVKNIIHDNDFRESNKVFAAATKELKRQGKGGVVHYPPIEKEDLQKLYAYFDSDNNVKLQEKVFVDLMLYFGRRGRENIHELKLSDFAATPDSNGKVYVYLTKDELTKNHQEDENTASGRMYSRDGHGSTYIRWGRNICSAVNTELVYSGYAAGEKHTYGSSYTGGASNMLCLPTDPELSNNTAGSDSYIYGTEFQDSHFGPGSADEDVPCSVCRSTNTSSSIMIPGRKTCYSGWKEEYAGILASGAYSRSASSYICVDSKPTYVPGGKRSNNDNLLYITRMQCGSLQCPPYNDNIQVYCVVCSK